MEFTTDSPIWTQLVAEFSRRIVVGDWLPDTRIPGVRELAADVGVNPNTAQRALTELERAGLVRSERTSGRFVTDNLNRIHQLRTELASDAADAFIATVRGLGMRKSQASEIIRNRWEQGNAPRTNPATAAHTPHES